MTDFATLDTWMEDRANFGILHDDECPDIECEGRMIYNTMTDLRECTGCNYSEEVT